MGGARDTGEKSYNHVVSCKCLRAVGGSGGFESLKVLLEGPFATPWGSQGIHGSLRWLRS